MNKILFILLALSYVCNCIESFKKESSFIATEEWQEIAPDQSIPRGLHVRINLTTGKKEAKLLEDGNSTDKMNGVVAITEEGNNGYNGLSEDHEQNQNNDNSRLHNMKELVKALKNLKNDFVGKDDDSELEKKFRNINQIKEELAEANLEFQQGPTVVSHLVSQFEVASSDADRLGILNDLEFKLHELDAANDFVKLAGASKVIIAGLNSTNEMIRKTTMTVVGAAAQSNPIVQVNFLQQKVMLYLTTLLVHTDDVVEQSRCLYGLSSLIRGFPFGQKKFFEIGGLDILLQLLQDTKQESINFQIKIIKLIRNLLDENVNAIGDRAVQLKKIDISSQLVEGGWCRPIASLLKFAIYEDVMFFNQYDDDMLEPLIGVMNHLASSCKSDFLLYDRKIRNLATVMRENYVPDESYGDLLNAVVLLLSQITRTDEL